MNRVYFLGLVFLTNLSFFSSASSTAYVPGSCRILGYCNADETVQKTIRNRVSDFDRQIKFFTDGPAFWQGMTAHVRDHLLVGVIHFQVLASLRQDPSEPNTSCLSYAQTTLKNVLVWLETNKDAIIAAYNDQCNKALEDQRTFDQGWVFDTSAKLKGLESLPASPFCKAAPVHDDLESLCHLVDQRRNIQEIQSRQMKDQQEEQHQPDKKPQERTHNRKGNDTNGTTLELPHDPAQPKRLAGWLTNVWTHVRVPGTWSPSYVLGVVVLGIAVATTIWKNKIDEWLLHDEQDDVNTKQVKRKLDELEQQLLQQLKHSRQP
jgi:hypothetical protein